MKRNQEKQQNVLHKKFSMEPIDQVIFYGCIGGTCKSLDYDQQVRITQLYYYLNPSLKKKEAKNLTHKEKKTWGKNLLYIVLLFFGALAVLIYWSMQ